MKKNIFLLILIIMVCVSCRQDNDYILNPNDPVQANYDTYTGQFEVVWNAINSGYIFWDITDVDWDQRHRELKPRFEVLDSIYKASGERADSATFTDLYKELTKGLVDHHMLIKLKDGGQIYSFRPGMDEVQSRSYYYERSSTNLDIFNNEFQSSIGSDFKLVSHGIFCGYELYTLVYYLPDGRIIPYLRSDCFADLSSARKVAEGTDSVALAAKQYVATMDAYADLVVNTPREKLAGAIVDVCFNGGGSMGDLIDYCGLFSGEKLLLGETRQKEGMGRYENSPWVPCYLTCPEKHRDMAAENIPVVVLCNLWSASCAESTTATIKNLPTGHAIGERTYGAHGPLLNSSYYSLNYSGVVGDPNLNTVKHYIYTSNFQIRYGGKCLEGIGITPDEEVYGIGFNDKFQAALNYIQNYK